MEAVAFLTCSRLSYPLTRTRMSSSVSLLASSTDVSSKTASISSNTSIVQQNCNTARIWIESAQSKENDYAQISAIYLFDNLLIKWDDSILLFVHILKILVKIEPICAQVPAEIQKSWRSVLPCSIRVPKMLHDDRMYSNVGESFWLLSEWPVVDQVIRPYSLLLLVLLRSCFHQ